MASRHRGKSPAREQVVREGVNLYYAGPRTGLQQASIEQGRSREIDYLERFCEPRCTNTAVFERSVTQGGLIVDQFRVTCGSLDGFRDRDLAQLRKRYNNVWDMTKPGSAVVGIRQESYNGRAVLFDLSWLQCLFLLLTILTMALVLTIVFDLDQKLASVNLRQVVRHWFVSTYSDQESIERVFE